MLDYYTFFVFQEDPCAASGRAGGSVDEDGPLVFLPRGKVVSGHLRDEVGQGLCFQGLPALVLNVEFGEFQGPLQHPARHIWPTQELPHRLIGSHDDGVG